MRSLIVVLAFAFSLSSYAINMTPGYWEYKTNLAVNPMMEQMLKKLERMPPEQKKMVMQMMKAKMGGGKNVDLQGSNQITKKCMTKEDIAKMEVELQRGFKKEKDCTFKVTERTKSSIKGSMKCKDEKRNVSVDLKMKDSKNGVNKTTSLMTDKPVVTTLTWLSAKCPGQKSKKGSDLE